MSSAYGVLAFSGSTDDKQIKDIYFGRSNVLSSFPQPNRYF